MVQFVLDGSHRAHQMIDDLYSFATVGEGEQQKKKSIFWHLLKIAW